MVFGKRPGLPVAADARAVCDFDFRGDAPADADRDGAGKRIFHAVFGAVSGCTGAGCGRRCGFAEGMGGAGILPAGADVARDGEGGDRGLRLGDAPRAARGRARPTGAGARARHHSAGCVHLRWHYRISQDRGDGKCQPRARAAAYVRHRDSARCHAAVAGGQEAQGPAGLRPRGDRDHRPGRPGPGGADLLHGRRDRRELPARLDPDPGRRQACRGPA